MNVLTSARTQAAFESKFDNTSFQDDQRITWEMQEGDLAVFGIKEAGSLALLTTPPPGAETVVALWCSKNSSANEFSYCMQRLLSAYLVEVGVDEAALLAFLYQAQICVCFEVVVPRLLGDHGAAMSLRVADPFRPRCAYLAVTTMTHCGFRLPLETILNVCTRFRLLLVEMYVTDSVVAAIRAEKIIFEPRLRCQGGYPEVAQALGAIADLEHVCVLPHDQLFGTVLEGFVNMLLRGPGVTRVRQALAAYAKAMHPFRAALDAHLASQGERCLAQSYEETPELTRLVESAPRRVQRECQFIWETEDAGCTTRLMRFLERVYPGQVTLVEFAYGPDESRFWMVKGCTDELFYSLNLWQHSPDFKLAKLARGMMIVVGQGDDAVSNVAAVSVVAISKAKFMRYFEWTMGRRNRSGTALHHGVAAYLSSVRTLMAQFAVDDKYVDYDGLRVWGQLLEAHPTLFNENMYLDLALALHQGRVQLPQPGVQHQYALILLDLIRSRTTKKKMEKMEKTKKELKICISPEAAVVAAGFVQLTETEFTGQPGTCLVTQQFAGPVPPHTLVVLVHRLDEMDRGLQALRSKAPQPHVALVDPAKEWARVVAGLPPVTRQSRPPVRFVLVAGSTVGLGKTYLLTRVVKALGPPGTTVILHSDLLRVGGSDTFYTALAKVVGGRDEVVNVVLDRNFPDAAGLSKLYKQLAPLRKTTGRDMTIVAVVPEYLDRDVFRERVRQRKADTEHGLHEQVEGVEDVFESFFSKAMAFHPRAQQLEGAVITNSFLEHDTIENTLVRIAAHRGVELESLLSNNEGSLPGNAFARMEILRHNLHCTWLPPRGSPGWPMERWEQMAAVIRPYRGARLPLRLTEHIVATTADQRSIGFWLVDPECIPEEVRQIDVVYHVTDHALVHAKLAAKDAGDAARAYVQPGCASRKHWLSFSRTPANIVVSSLVVF